MLVAMPAFDQDDMMFQCFDDITNLSNVVHSTAGGHESELTITVHLSHRHHYAFYLHCVECRAAVGLAGVDGKDMAGTVERYGPATYVTLYRFLRTKRYLWILLDLQSTSFPAISFLAGE